MAMVHATLDSDTRKVQHFGHSERTALLSTLLSVLESVTEKRKPP